jgi:uncharacterized protein YecE (DUF72 family)
MAASIFLVAGLLADEHQPRVTRALAEHGLRRVQVERAGAALLARGGLGGQGGISRGLEHVEETMQARGRASPGAPPAPPIRVRAGHIRVGPSGWSYRSWSQTVARGVPMRARLAHIASLYNAVEVNGSHYRQIPRERYAAWSAETPPSFRFAVKGHRYVTHYLRLSNCGDPVRRLRDQAGGLGEKLAVVIWQLPAAFARDLGRLDEFLGVLGSWPETRHALELRHPSWFTEDVAARLAAARVASCLSDAPDFPMWGAVTTDLVYVRLHGHTRKYASSYARRTLAAWAARARAWAREGRDVHIYFDNDAEGAALPNASTLTRMLGLQTESAIAQPRNASTRQMQPPTSSLTSSAPSTSTVMPTGRPQTSPAGVTKPVRKSSYVPRARPFWSMGTRTTS